MASRRYAVAIGVILGTALAVVLIAKYMVYYLDQIECERLPILDEGLDNQSDPFRGDFRHGRQLSLWIDGESIG